MTEPATSGRPSDPGTPGNQPQDVGEVVDRLLNRLAWVILTLGTAATLGTLNRWVQHGWHIQHAIHVAVFLLLCAGVLLKRIPRNSRVAMILGALAVSGVCNLFFHGLAGTGFVFLTIVCVLGVVLGSLRAGWIATGMFAAVIIGIGTGVTMEWIPIVEDPAGRLRSSTEWIAQGAAVLALVTGTILAVHAIQQALRTSFERLDRRTKALEAEMAERRRMEEELLQAEKMQAIGRLAGGIAHDFNNQLAGIIGSAQLLQRKLPDHPVVNAHVELILTPARRAADLTAKLLAFARKGHIRSVPVDLHLIIKEVVSITESTMNPAIRIVLGLDATSSIIQGDPTLLQSALLNLALNARDAMPDGGELTFETENENMDINGQQKTRIVLRVRDTGVGMDPEVRSRIFEPFFTTKEPGMGTGMGLSAVHGTVASHGGNIQVDSEPGRGTVFVMTFPCNDTRLPG